MLQKDSLELHNSFCVAVLRCNSTGKSSSYLPFLLELHTWTQWTVTDDYFPFCVVTGFISI